MGDGRAAALLAVCALAACGAAVIRSHAAPLADERLLRASWARPRKATAVQQHAASVRIAGRTARRSSGVATPLFASAAAASLASSVATDRPRSRAGSGLRAQSPRHQQVSESVAGSTVKTAGEVARKASTVQASTTTPRRGQVARNAQMPLRTAMSIVETGAASSLAAADKNAVEAALLRAALSVPGVRTAEKAAAQAAVRAAANKPSAAWLAGAKSLAARNPFASMNTARGPHQPAEHVRKRGGSLAASRRGRHRAQIARVKRGPLARRRTSQLEVFSTIRPNSEGEVEERDPNDPYVKGTDDIGTPVEPEEVQPHWAHGHPHPYEIVKRDDRYVPVGRLLTHRDGVTRREAKMPAVENQEQEEPAEEQPEAENGDVADCTWGKDVYGRCYTRCTPTKEDYSICHDDEGQPIWKDPVPISTLCKGHESAQWCQEEEGGDAPTEEHSRTVQLSSISPDRQDVRDGSPGAANAATAPTLGGGVSVPGGKVIWLPLDSLVKPGSPSVPSEARIDATPRALDVVGAPASQPRTAGISVPTFSPKKFSKEVLYGPNGKPLYAFYARDAATAAKVSSGGAGERQLAARAPQASPALSQKDKEIERRVLFKLLREEEEQASSFKARAQQLEEEKSRAVRVASSSHAALVVSVMAVVLPLLTMP
ncbi:MAG: hypothetical protein ACPIOQ_08500 [Promethearchaeia archaeon]